MGSAKAGQNGPRLTPSQQRAIAALLASRSVRLAAVASHIGERTLKRWLTLPHFRAALASAEDELLRSHTRRLMAGLDAATALIECTIHDDTVKPETRLRAASIFIDQTLRGVELSRLADRVGALEALAAVNNQQSMGNSR